ncbi:hypothetical protein ACWCQ0_42990 [Streptomyces massasporeus]|uniref:hypothetical protein n=1 Tax=Streptomyces massasporeus TaxID=67324 RepID=UPI003411B02A
MIENIEQHVEGAARSLVDLVRALQERGIDYPLRRTASTAISPAAPASCAPLSS